MRRVYRDTMAEKGNDDNMEHHEISLNDISSRQTIIIAAHRGHLMFDSITVEEREY